MKICASLKAVGVILTFALLASCGGGGDDAVTAPVAQPGSLSQGGETPATPSTSGGDQPGGDTADPAPQPDPAPDQEPSPGTDGEPAPAPNPNPDPQPAPTPEPEPFQATLVRAPVDGEQVTGVVRLEVRGTGIGNVELLPQTGYAPRLGVFTVAEDRTYAHLDFDTTTVPNGLLALRISAFDAASGSGDANEIVVMQARTWSLRNLPPPDGTAAGRAARCQYMGLAYTPIDDAQPVVCINWELPSPPIPPEQCTTVLDTPYSNPEDKLPVLRDGTRIPKLYCEPAANNGVINPGCECWQ